METILIEDKLNRVLTAAFKRQARKFSKNKIPFLFAPIVVAEKKQYKEQAIFFSKPFQYGILAPEVTLDFDKDAIQHENLQIIANIVADIDKNVKHDFKSLRRFLSFLCWQPYAEAKKLQDKDLMAREKELILPDLDPNQLSQSLQTIKRELIGVEGMVTKMGENYLNSYTMRDIKRPRGLLLCHSI
jgi:thiamine kinase-like enzyme